MICPNCQFDNPDGMKFCGNCGRPQQVPCPGCGFENPPGFKFCGNCGTQLEVEPSVQEISRPPAPIPQPSEGERRHLTVMFCDLVDSTALSHQLDPEDLRTIVTEYQGICGKVIARFEGHIAQYLGDGILVYFGYPTAYENSAHRAVSSGLGIIEAIRQFSQRLQADKGIELSVRIGIHTGHVVIGSVGNSGQSQQLALGVTPNIAARLEGLAEANTVVISGDTHKLVCRLFAFENKGAHSIKGISFPIEVYQVLRENTARSRFEANKDLLDQIPMVGRDQEVKRLFALWEEAEQGRSHTVMLSGEAGLGKSRVLQQLLAHVAAAEKDAWLIVLQCSPYHKQTAYFPLVQAIKDLALQLKGNESSGEQLRRLEGFLLQYGFSLDEMVPLFANIMALALEGTSYQPSPFSNEQQHQKITQALITIFLERSRVQNLLLIFEDLHWADPFTLEVVTQLINQAPDLHILTILSFRPEFDPSWRVQSHTVPMALSNLPGNAVEEIIASIAHGKSLPQELKDQIIQKTDGVPLFVEELTKMVLGSEIVQEHEDRYELNKPLSALEIPSTLHDSLIARLDRMSNTKEIAQIGAVIGREFTYELIHLTVRMEEQALRTCLGQLVHSEILLQHGIPPQATYKFRHALIRDAAYESLLKSQRKHFHQRIAQALTAHFPDEAESHPEVAAYHFEKAGLFRDAVLHWTKAGEKALHYTAYDEALNYTQRALTLNKQMAQDDDQSEIELKILSVQARVLMMTGGWGSKQAFEASARMKYLAEEVGDKMNLFKALTGLTTFQLWSGYPKEALQYAKEALATAKQLQSMDALLEAHRLIGQASIYVGELKQSVQSFDKALSLYASAGGNTVQRMVGESPGIFNLIQSSHVLWSLGYPKLARDRAKSALDKADEVNRPYIQAICAFINAIIAFHTGDLQACFQHAQQCIAVGEKYGLMQFAGETKTLLGSALVQAGEVEEGFRKMDEALQWRMQNNVMTGMHVHLTLQAAMCLHIGDVDSGLQVVTKDLEFSEKYDDQYFLSETYRLKGELLWVKYKEARSKEIGDCFKKSMQLAKKQQAKSFELRTAMSIARWWSARGKSAQALELLSDVYDWFTEGFETRDLKEARLLMDKMSIEAISAN